MANTYLTRTTSTAGNGQKFTISTWVKRSGTNQTNEIINCYGGNTADTNVFHWGFQLQGGADSKDGLEINLYSGSSHGGARILLPNRKFRDCNAWYHLVLAVDTTQATNTNRLKLYVNGVQETSFVNSYYPSQNYSYVFGLGTSKMFTIGAQTYNGGSNYSSYFNGLMSHFHFIDGTAYDASAFGSTDSTTGEWQLNTSPSVTYGTNGFFILKDGNSGTDQSTNSNNFTVGGGTLTKSEDSPSNVFATMNPLANFDATSTFSNGNNTTSMPYEKRTFNISTLAMPSNKGKFYAEVKMIAPSQYTNIGLSNEEARGNNGMGNSLYEWGYSNGNQILRNNSSNISGWTGANYSTNDIVGIALDNDNQKLYFSVNGVYQNSGVPTSGSTGTGGATTSTGTPFYHFAGGDYHTANEGNTIYSWNFGNGYFGTTAVSSAGTNASGNGIFEYDVPTGYTALSTKGLNL